MVYGITGNTTKDAIWKPISLLVNWLAEQKIEYVLHRNVASGLKEKGLIGPFLSHVAGKETFIDQVDMVLSFGGDGTLLNSAREVGASETPILGVNIGRLGFLAHVEERQVEDAILRMEKGEYSVHARMTLSGTIDNEEPEESIWALNEIVIARGGPVGLLSIEVLVDGTPLNQYWADGLIIATPTGSTAYSLAVGGPIVAPGSNVFLISPLAPHSLTVRPVILPASSVIEARVVDSHQPFVVAADGRSTTPKRGSATITICKADHEINLVQLPEHHYFQTLRTKLMWGGGIKQ